MDLKGCPHNKYGGQCSHDCNCANGGLCHDFNGACYCQKGWTGSDCRTHDPLLELTQSSEKVVYTGNVTLTCKAYGMNTEMMNLIRNGEIIMSRERYTLGRSGDALILEIVRVQHNDEGLYLCNAVYPDGRNLTATLNLTTIGEQHFIEEPTDVTVTAGGNVTLQCAVANRVGQRRWFAKRDILLAVENEIVANWAKEHFSVDSVAEKGTYNLNIGNVNTEDDREYHCEVGPAYIQKGIVSNFAQLTVIERAVMPYIEDTFEFGSLSFLVRSSESVRVTCRANDGKPPASIRWYKNGELVTRNVSTELEVGTMNRMNTVSVLTVFLTKEDVGKNITCESWNDVLGYHDRTSVVLEDIKYKPLVDVTYLPKAPKDGNDVTFYCNVDANPNNITYRWEVDHVPVVRQHDTSLKLHGVKGQDSAILVVCWATNDIGSSYGAVSVKVDKDEKVTQLTGILVGFVGLILVTVAPVLTYRHRYRIQRRLLWHFGGYEENDGKTFDAFVSYCGSLDGESEDEKFVRRVLIPELERDGKYILCEHHRNFVPGIDIYENIVQAINSSRRTILILSPRFVESEWCRYEFLKAQEEMLKKKTRIIPIMFEDISPVEDMDANLKSLLREISYIPWSREGGITEKFWNNLKYAMPRKRPNRNRNERHNIDNNGEEKEHIPLLLTLR
ncbi:interleukin-18 receptor accessory protein-like isoform X2 [Ptychodera flava]